MEVPKTKTVGKISLDGVDMEDVKPYTSQKDKLNVKMKKKISNY